MTQQEQVIAWCQSQLGVMEQPPNSNRVPYWDMVGMPRDQGLSWCAAFTLAAYLECKVRVVTRSVGVWQCEHDYQAAGRWWPISQGQPGDQICYHIGQGHTGILIALDPIHKTLTAIEGNTSATKAGSQSNGGIVALKTRPWSLVDGVGRPWFADNPTPSPEEDDVKYTAITDPTSGGSWQCRIEDGAIYAERGAPYLGGLNTHPEWHAGGDESGGHSQVQTITEFRDPSGVGYTIWCLADSDNQLHAYDFPRSGKNKGT